MAATYQHELLVDGVERGYGRLTGTCMQRCNGDSAWKKNTSSPIWQNFKFEAGGNRVPKTHLFP